MIVRYLTNDPPDQAANAANLIDSTEELGVTDAVIMETAYVLRSAYGIPRVAIVDQLLRLVERDNIETFRLEKTLVLQALLMCRPSGRVSFADALLWASALSSDERLVYSFDQRFPSDGIEVRRSR
jgi:predicted nucleic acid-binding protein